MSYEQPDLSFLTEEDKEDFKKQEQALARPETVHKPDDDLNFKCEVCGDRVDGCPSCGWGRNMD